MTPTVARSLFTLVPSRMHRRGIEPHSLPAVARWFDSEVERLLVAFATRKMHRPGIEPRRDVLASLRASRLLQFPPTDFVLTAVRTEMHRPGIEPGLLAWEANVLPLDQRCSLRHRRLRRRFPAGPSVPRGSHRDSRPFGTARQRSRFCQHWLFCITPLERSVSSRRRGVVPVGTPSFSSGRGTHSRWTNGRKYRVTGQLLVGRTPRYDHE